MLNRRHSPALRALRTDRTTQLEHAEENVWTSGGFGQPTDLFFGGDMESAIALGGQVMGRIDEVLPVAEIIDQVMSGLRVTLERLAAAYPLSQPRRVGA